MPDGIKFPPTGLAKRKSVEIRCPVVLLFIHPTMAWRLNKSVVKGEIDNRKPGKVTGRVWLAGRQDPIVLDLEGNPLKDLAGARVSFSNASPAPGDEVGLNPLQKGVVGDITGSRKVRVPDVVSTTAS